ncbi:MAG: hypothetical protein HY823_08345 [Acidobacteria bacterium]|nr:hypothetical protein [Acidobacteriota bacterium]
MRRLLIPALLATLIPVAGCRSRVSPGPEWLQSAPRGCQVAFSAEARWLLEHKEFQTLMAQSKLAEQALDLFLSRARIAPHLETGRITFFVLDLPTLDKPNTSDLGKAFLIRLSGFKNPKNLYIALADSFPAEGSLRAGGKDLPLHMIMDVNQFNIRALADPDGPIWIGDIRALATLGAKAPGPRSPLRRAGEWVNPSAAFQGFLLPDSLLARLPVDRLPKGWSSELPKGLEALAWSIQPAADPKAPHRLELAVAGSPDGISQTVPWLQRLVAISNSLDPNARQVAELIQEKDRAGIRCSLNQEQLNSLMAKLGQPAFRVGPGPKA